MGRNENDTIACKGVSKNDHNLEELLDLPLTNNIGDLRLIVCSHR